MKNAKRSRGSIIPRGPETWLVRVFAGEQGGKRIYRHETVHGSKRDAEKKRTELLSKVDTGTMPASSALTVDKFLDGWLKAVEPTLRAKTHEDYTGLLARYVRKALGDRPLAKLTPLDVQAIYSAMSAKGLSSRTIRYTHSVLQSALRYAVDQDYLAKNPARRAKLPRQKRSEAREEIRVLAPDQVAKFMAAAGADHLYPVFALAIATGMRPSEYLGLQWKDLDLEAGQLAVRRTLAWKKGSEGREWFFEDVKRKRSRRTLDLGEQLAGVLRGYKKRQSEIRLRNADAWNDAGLVFTEIDGAPLYERNVLRAFRRVLTAAKLPELRLYDLRHTYATNALVGGISAKVVSARLGHASVAFTLDTYAHVLPAQEKDAAAAADDVVFGGRS